MIHNGGDIEHYCCISVMEVDIVVMPVRWTHFRGDVASDKCKINSDKQLSQRIPNNIQPWHVCHQIAPIGFRLR
jgi:hypothetical protein